jgi:hypothetical protein
MRKAKKDGATLPSSRALAVAAVPPMRCGCRFSGRTAPLVGIQ